jgi:hypothetical protein
MGGAGEGGRKSEECDANSIHTGDVGVSTQSALEELRGVSIIDGNLIVELAISSLDPLRCLKSVSGSLHFGDPYELRQLDYLENLESVGGNLIFEATLVPDVQSLTGLRHVGGDLQIIWNLHLSELDGLFGVTSIGGDLVIEGNDELTSCEAAELVSAIDRSNIAGDVSVLIDSGADPCP